MPGVVLVRVQLHEHPAPRAFVDQLAHPGLKLRLRVVESDPLLTDQEEDVATWKRSTGVWTDRRPVLRCIRRALQALGPRCLL